MHLYLVLLFGLIGGVRLLPSFVFNVFFFFFFFFFFFSSV